MHTAPHALKAVSAAGAGWQPSSTCSLADGTGGLRGCGQGGGRARPGWWGVYVPPAHMHQPGRERAPCTPVSPARLPFVTPSHSSSLRPQLTRHPSPDWTFRRARSWHRAPHLPAAGHLVSSAWNATLLNMHIHMQTQPYAHMYAYKATCTHTHPMCIHACVHTCNPLMSTYTYVHTHTPMCTHTPALFSPGLLGLSLELAHQLG